MPKKSTPKPEQEEKRSRSWATIIYPDSAPKDYENIISNLLLEGFLSPLHTDVDEEKQLEKKPHRHFLLQFATVKSSSQVKAICAQFGGAGAECVANTRAYARYLCHLDQPNKKRYNPSEVKCFGAVDYLALIEAPSSRYQVIRDMKDYCMSHRAEIGFSFGRLLDYAAEHREDWFRHLCDDCAYVMKVYLRAKERDLEHAQEQNPALHTRPLKELVDVETGEVYHAQ